MKPAECNGVSSLSAVGIPEEEWDLLVNALEEPIEQLIAVEAQDSAQFYEVEQRLCVLAGSRPVFKQTINLAEQTPQSVWQQARQLTNKTTDKIPLLLITLNVCAEDNAQRQRLAEFWRGMNQLRENWYYLPAQTLFLLSRDAYQHLTLNADHLKRWISLELRLREGATDLAVLARPGLIIGDYLMDQNQTYAFDVFLSHNSQDTPAVRELASALRGRGLTVWLDEDELIPGRNWQVLIEQGLKDSKAIAVCVGAAGLGPWEDEEMQAALTQAVKNKTQPVIPVVLPDAPQPPTLPPFLANRTWVDLRPALTADKLDLLMWGITGKKPAASQAQSPSTHAITIAPTRLPPAPAQIFGREAELQRLDEAWANPGVHVLVIQAWGGAGKTTLVATWLAQLAHEGWRGAERVFDWSFYSQGSREQGGASADAFVQQALRFFGDPQLADSAASPWDKGSRLAQLVAQRPSLLVLDGLEPLQYPPGALVGQLKDPALASLLKGLARHNPGLCVVTSREAVADLSTWAASTAPLWQLPALSETAGVALLRKTGVHGAAAELRRLVQDVRGHAMTLSLLGRFLFKAHQGDIRRRDRVTLDKAANLLHESHVFHVMQAYERWLDGSGDSGARSLAVLRLLGLFDRPATQAQLAVLRQAPPIVGLTEALQDLDEEEWNLALADLAELGLLPADTANEAIEAHPLIREYFARRLREQTPDAWREAHRRLYQYLCTSVEYRPDTLERLQPLYQAVYHGCQAGLVAEALNEVYRDRIRHGDEFYNIHKLGGVSANLGAIACFFLHPWRRILPNLSESDQAWLLNEAAYSLHALGRLTEALETMRSSLEGYEKQTYWEYAANVASNLSELELDLGEIIAALEYAEKSIAYADCRWVDMAQRIRKRVTWANALYQAGNIEAAKEQFQKAEYLQAENYPQRHLLNCTQGFYYCELLLAEAEKKAWVYWVIGASSTSQHPIMLDACLFVIQRATQTLALAERHLSLLAIGLDHLSLGRAALYRTMLTTPRPTDNAAHTAAIQLAFAADSSARQQLDAALDFLRRSGDQTYIPRALLTRAWLHVLENQPEPAATLLDEAEDIAGRGPMRLHLADIYLHRARLFRDRAALAKARDLILQTGYHRRRAELADAEAALQT